MSIKFEEGKNYVNRNGDVLECKYIYGDIVLFRYVDNIIGYFVYKDGAFKLSMTHELDIVAEYEPKEEEAKQKPKTVEDWLNTLPELYRKMAFANIIEQGNSWAFTKSCQSLAQAINKGFNWAIAKHPSGAVNKDCFWRSVALGELPLIPWQEETEIDQATRQAGQQQKENYKQEEFKIWKMPLPDLSVLSQERNKTNDKYNRMIKDRTGKKLGIVDVYCVGDAFGVDSKPLNHALKKILCAGTRGKGDEVQDLEEAIQAIQRRLMEIRK